jgi:RNA polymerase sigma-70 factor (ECF subfamily)
LRNGYLKTRGRRLALPISELDVGALPQPVPAEPIDTEELQQAINTLGDEFKVVVLMFYFEHRSYREIAELLDIPPGTVMSRLARAKAHLRRRLSEDEHPRSEPEPRNLQMPHDRPTAIRR